jgi:LCP family protein required for cell wall assembly
VSVNKKVDSTWIWFAPIYIFFVPGLFQLLIKRRVLGMAALAVPILSIFGLSIVSFSLLGNQELIFSLFSNTNFLLFLEIIILFIGVFLVTLGFLSIYDVRKIVDKNPKKYILQFAILLVLLFQSFIALNLVSTIDAQRNLLSAVFSTENANSYVKDRIETSGRVNILILGGDAGEGRWGLRPDSISVASVDIRTGKTTLIGLPRNMQNFPFAQGSTLSGVFPNGYDCGNSCLLNSLYTFAGGRNDLFSDPSYVGKDVGVEATKQAVEGITGLPIDYFILIDMASFADIVDSIGGINVCVPENVFVNGNLVFLAGCQQMDGTKALEFARTRQDSSDYQRMERQRLVQDALISQSDPTTILNNFQSLAQTGARYVKTDIPQNEIGFLLSLASKTRSQPTNKVELVPPLIDVTFPDISLIQKIVADATSSTR